MDVIPYCGRSDQPGSSESKNRVSCERLAGLFDGVVLSPDSLPSRQSIVFPFDPMVQAELSDYLRGGHDISVYGSVVPVKNMADKAMLHELVSEDAYCPGWYAPEFSRWCRSSVLPGYTVFTKADLDKAVLLLRRQGYGGVIIKDPSADGGKGQFVVEAGSALSAEVYLGDLRMTGRVVEPMISAAGMRSYSVGVVSVGSHEVSWVGELKSVWHESSERYLFASNKMTLVRGDFDVLAQTIDDAGMKAAIEKSNAVHSRYLDIGVYVYRATYDILSGVSGGRQLMGVVDPSLRPSASTPGEIVGLEHMIRNNKDSVDVELMYLRDNQDQIGLDASCEHEVFVDTSHAKIVTRVIER